MSSPSRVLGKALSVAGMGRVLALPCASVLALPKPPKHLPGVFSPSVWLTPSNAGRLLQGVCGCLNKPPLSGTFQQEWPWLSLDFP